MSSKKLAKILLTLGVTYLVGNYPLTNSSQPIAIASSISDFLVEQPEAATTSEPATLPVPIQTAVLEEVARRTSRTVAEFRVLNAQRRQWSDGCLGIPQPDELCTQVITPGWQVIVTDGRRNWVYRTDVLGDRVKLAEAPQPSEGESN
ncbi:hypothetical protein [Myxosarcina sp. GI1(2024)]